MNPKTLLLYAQYGLHEVRRTDRGSILLNYLSRIRRDKSGWGRNHPIKIRIANDVLLLGDAVVSQRIDGICQSKLVLEDAEPAPKHELLVEPLNA
jgi:hypothetical protein